MHASLKQILNRRLRMFENTDRHCGMASAWRPPHNRSLRKRFWEFEGSGIDPSDPIRRSWLPPRAAFGGDQFHHPDDDQLFPVEDRGAEQARHACKSTRRARLSGEASSKEQGFVGSEQESCLIIQGINRRFTGRASRARASSAASLRSHARFIFSSSVPARRCACRGRPC